MKIKLIAVGTKMPDWVTTGYKNYAQRLPKDCAMELIEIPAAKRSKSQSASVWMEKEGQQILKSIDNQDWVVALEVKGKNWGTLELANQLKEWQTKGCNVCLVVGGPDGLSAQVRQRANQMWSLSALTMPHPIVRIVLAEAVYRAWSVTVNHPYHRE